MNLLVIIADSLRPEYLGCYGNEWVATPNLDRVAAEGVRFERYFAASFPTRPMRKDFHSGRFTFPYTAWSGNWERGEIVVTEILHEAGYATALIGDTPSNEGFERGFDHFGVIRGQGHELAPDGALARPLPAAERKLRTPREHLERILRNEATWHGEEDRYVAQSMRAAARWLEGQHASRKPFFLLVDTFDPHEPWNPPRYYIDRYDADYRGDELFEPAYEPADYATEAEVQHMRCLYAAEVSLVDRWIGHLLTTLSAVGADEDTAVVITSDHGFYHGEHGLIGKVQLDREGRICRRWPLYATIAQAPLLMRLPGGPQGKVRRAFCQPPDLAPTLLELTGAPVPPTMQGASLLPVLTGTRRKVRDAAITSHTYVQDDAVRCPTSFRDDEYLYVYGGDEAESALYHLPRDPEEQHNVIGRAPDVARRLHEQMLAFLEAIECPPERLAGRREFPAQQRSEVPYDRVI